jgi:hypothetical protein
LPGHRAGFTPLANFHRPVPIPSGHGQSDSMYVQFNIQL